MTTTSDLSSQLLFKHYRLSSQLRLRFIPNEEKNWAENDSLHEL